MLSRLDRFAYRSQHLSFLINATVMQEAARLVTRTPRPQICATEVRTLLRRRDELHDRDLANVDAGMYPRELLFDIPIRQFARALPRLVADTPSVVRRMRRKDFKDIPERRSSDRYPAYYRRTFHWQTDGYFSDHSAEVYELGVELLFRGTADVMRRQIIPPITRFLRECAGRIAAAARRRVRHRTHAAPALAGASGAAAVHGVDLSPDYVKHRAQAARRRPRARDRRRERRGPAVRRCHVRRRDERLPVPRAAAQRAPQRRARDVPGGATRRARRDRGLGAARRQRATLAAALRTFPREFHEPFYTRLPRGRPRRVARRVPASRYRASSRPSLPRCVVARRPRRDNRVIVIECDPRGLDRATRYRVAHSSRRRRRRLRHPVRVRAARPLNYGAFLSRTYGFVAPLEVALLATPGLDRCDRARAAAAHRTYSRTISPRSARRRSRSPRCRSAPRSRSSARRRRRSAGCTSSSGPRSRTRSFAVTC